MKTTRSRRFLATAAALATVCALIAAGGLTTARAEVATHALSTAADEDPPPSVPGENFRPAPRDAAICVPTRGANTQVNQDCPHTDAALSTVSGRGQTKNSPSIAANPRNTTHLVSGYNDYRSGDVRCGSSYSLNGGKTWTDVALPASYVDGTFVDRPREDYQAGAAPTVAWDSHDNVYLLCMMYNRGVAGVSPNPDMSGGIYLFRSVAGAQGRSWSFFPTPVVENKLLSGGPDAFSILDSPRIAVDSNPRSPYRDRIHVTWMFQDSDLTNYVFAAHSDDYGTTFSDPVQIGADSDLCEVSYGLPTDHGICNLSDNPAPIVAPDGTLHIAWVNRNGPQASENDNKNQVLVTTSRDGGDTFTTPVRAGESYELPDCDTYQGRGPSFGGIYNFSCVPEKGAGTQSVYRASNYVRGVVNPHNGDVVLAYGSYLNSHSSGATCLPEFLSMESFRPLYSDVKGPGCNNDILISVSTDAGRTFSSSGVPADRAPSITRGPRQGASDQFWPDIALAPGGRIAISYLDRAYAAPTSPGTDVTLTTFRLAGTDRAGQPRIEDLRNRRVTTSTMPVPSQHDLGRFYGDWTSLAFSGARAVPVWSDTRTPATALCPGSAEPGRPPRLCYFDANEVQANTQNISSARVRVR